MRIIAGEARGRRLTPPRDQSTRPLLDRIRESLFATLPELEGTHVLDLFAGVGSFGLEAVSRGARHATFVENGRIALGILARNVAELSFQSRCTILAGNALSEPAAPGQGGPFSVVFLDPPFRMFATEPEIGRVFARVSDLLQGPLLTPGAILLLRHPTKSVLTYPMQPVASRRYGESIVIQYVKSQP